MFVMDKEINDAKLDVVRSNPVGKYVNDLNESYDICENPVSQGLMCTFKHKDKWYFADLSFVDVWDCYECAIFNSNDSEGNVSDWNALYAKKFHYDMDAIFKSNYENGDELKEFHEIMSKDIIGCIEAFVLEKGM